MSDTSGKGNPKPNPNLNPRSQQQRQHDYVNFGGRQSAALTEHAHRIWQ